MHDGSQSLKLDLHLNLMFSQVMPLRHRAFSIFPNQAYRLP